MTMQGIATTEKTTVHIINAFTASNQQLAAQPATPAWYVVGAFFLEASAAAKLRAVGAVSVNGNTLRFRLYDVTSVAPVSGSVTPNVTTLIDAKVESGTVDLVGGRIYQVQAECIGASGYGVMRSAELTQPPV